MLKRIAQRVGGLKRIVQCVGVGRFLQYSRSWGKPNAVFIWIPKAAGASVYNVLKNYNASPILKTIQLLEDFFPNKGIVTFGHMDYAKLVAQKHVSERFDGSAFKFCFSRDPYSRSVSLFFYLKRVGSIEKEKTFLSFCRGLSKTTVPDVGLYNVKGLSQCNPQSRWLRDVEINYVGKVENLEADLNQILSSLSLPLINSIPRVNSTEHESFRSYYCKESKLIVEDYYADDFEAFNYEVKEWL